MVPRKRRPTRLQAGRGPGAQRPRDADPFDWIGRALPRAGVLPPDEAEAAIRAGRVRVAGRVVTEPLGHLRPGDPVRLDGHEVSVVAPVRVLMFHKPRGVVTATSDRQGQGTVFDRLLPQLPPILRRFGWHACGRLDRDTTGLLLFTNHEHLVAHLTSPATHLPKRYRAQVGSRAEDAKLEPLRRGIRLSDGPARPALARVLSPDTVELTLTEGKNHQVKRMLGAVGLPVLALHRAAVGSLELDVPEEGWRELSQDEVREKLGFGAGR